ncbi:hypothetical protein Lser_V15G34972 [Lactuca serriola]
MESGDIATYNFERITWLKIIGLPPNLWSEENFSKIAGSMGRVIIPFEVDISTTNLVYGKVGVITNSLSSISSEQTVEINGKTIKIRIDEVDLDWTPLKQYEQSMEDTSLSDEDEDEVDDMVGTNDEDHVSDTFPMQYEREEPEEGEIRAEVGTKINSYINVAGKHSTSVKALSPENMVAVGIDGGSETDSHRESQRTQINANVNELSVNETPNGEAVNAALSKNLESNNLGHMNSSNGPLNMLPLYGCFGPFPNNMVRSESFSGRINNNFKGSYDKRRRILTPIPD